MSVTTALVEFHRQIFSDMQSELKENIGTLPASLQKYHREYRRDFLKFKSVSSLPELLSHIEQCNIVYCGDYHTLRQAQMTNLNLLQQVIRKRQVVLATELVFSNQQKILDRYMKGELNETQFLLDIQYRHNFGFNWDNYRPIFEFARENRIPVMAIDLNQREREIRLDERDKHAAHLISGLSCKNPDTLIWVIIGDLHLARTHLPGFVEYQLSHRRLQRKVLVIHQNNEWLFWKIAHQGLRGESEIIQLDENAYCIFNTAPWIKLYSYVHWLEQSIGRNSCGRLGDEVHRMVASMSEFLGKEDASLLDFAVYEGHDSSFLSEFPPGSYGYHFCRSKFHQKRSFMIPSRRLIYLADDHVNHATDLAARYLHAHVSGYRNKPVFSKGELARRIMHAALGFLGSKLLNHHRRPIASPVIEQLFREGRYQRLLDPASSVRSRDAELIRYLFVRNIDGVRMLDWVASRVGENIYRAMLQERLRLRELSKLFDSSFESTASQRVLTKFHPLVAS